MFVQTQRDLFLLSNQIFLRERSIFCQFHFCCWDAVVEEAFKSSSLETTEEEEKLSWKKSRCSASQTKDCKHQLMDGCKQHQSFLIFFPPSLLFCLSKYLLWNGLLIARTSCYILIAKNTLNEVIAAPRWY